MLKPYESKPHIKVKLDPRGFMLFSRFIITLASITSGSNQQPKWLPACAFATTNALGDRLRPMMLKPVRPSVKIAKAEAMAIMFFLHSQSILEKLEQQDKETYALMLRISGEIDQHWA